VDDGSRGGEGLAVGVGGADVVGLELELHGGVDHPGHEVAGQRHRLIDQLRPTAGEVVVDRPVPGPL
jgi:hypothetical protein